MAKEDSDIIFFMILSALTTFLISSVINVSNYTDDDKIKSGSNFKIYNATYKCVKTNELKVGEL